MFARVRPAYQSVTQPSAAFCGDPERRFAERLAADAVRVSGCSRLFSSVLCVCVHGGKGRRKGA